MRSCPSGTEVLFKVKLALVIPAGTHSGTTVSASRLPTSCVGIDSSWANALMLSVKLSPQSSSPCIVAFQHAGHHFDPWLQPQIFQRGWDASCAASSATCVSWMIHSDSDWMTDNIPSTSVRFFLSSLVRQIGCVLDRFNSDLNGSSVGLRQLLNHEFESVKTFPSGEHSCCIRKRFAVPLRAYLLQDVLYLVTMSVRITLFLTDVCLVQAS